MWIPDTRSDKPLRLARPADGLTVGVEEEFFLVDDAGRLVDRAPEALRETDHDGIDLKPELLRCQVESATEVCHTGQDVHRELTNLRGRLATAAARHGARLAASATVVHRQPHGAVIAPGTRYHRIAERYGPIVVGASTCGCHVHVGVADKPVALKVVNHLRPWLPVLLAVSANSPFLHGKDTGYASARHLIYLRWPCAGPPPYLDSVDEYETITATLLETGAALDRKMIYWYVRPSEHQPTVEIRVSDVLATIGEAALLAVLIRTLVGHALELIDAGIPAPRVPSDSIKAGLWRAAKDGSAVSAQIRRPGGCGRCTPSSPTWSGRTRPGCGKAPSWSSSSPLWTGCAGAVAGRTGSGRPMSGAETWTTCSTRSPSTRPGWPDPGGPAGSRGRA